MSNDVFRGPVYYAEALGKFQVFNHRERPGPGSWVVVPRSGGEGLALEQFHGQPFICVARFLHVYPLKYSEQDFSTVRADPETKPKPKRKRVYWPRRLAA